MKFSMLQAAKEIGVSQSSMSRYIHSGRVSAEKLPNGGFEIDPAELFRAFPPGWRKKGETGSGTLPRNDAEPDGNRSETPNETGALEAQVKMLREMLSRADLDLDRQRREASDTIDDLRRRLDQEAEERRALNARLLTYQAPPDAMTPPPPAPPAQAHRRGFLGIFRKAG